MLGEVDDALRQALDRLQLQQGWEEWERSEAGCPEYARNLGSPSILVNGVDVSPSANNDSSCCRVYLENPQFRGCPSVDSIIEALNQAS